MTVRVQFFADLRDLAAPGQIDQPLPNGATVTSLLPLLYARFPSLAGRDSAIRVAVGLEYVARSQPLADGDLVSLMPPVQGG